MTNDFAIDILKQYREKPTLINEIETQEEATWLEEALDMGIKSLEQTRWIPVTERLPQINEWVLCQCRTGYKVLRLTSYGCYCNDTQEYIDSFVIAWMPLPKPYKGVE